MLEGTALRGPGGVTIPASRVRAYIEHALVVGGREVRVGATWFDQRFRDMIQYRSLPFGSTEPNYENVVANALEQLMTLAILVAGALLVMRNDGFTIGMLVAFQMFAGGLLYVAYRDDAITSFPDTGLSVVRTDDEGRAVGTLSTLGLAPLPLSNNIGDLSRELAYAQAHSGIAGLELVPGTEPFDAVLLDAPCTASAQVSRLIGSSKRKRATSSRWR